MGEWIQVPAGPRMSEIGSNGRLTVSVHAVIPVSGRRYTRFWTPLYPSVAWDTRLWHVIPVCGMGYPSWDTRHGIPHSGYPSWDTALRIPVMASGYPYWPQDTRIGLKIPVLASRTHRLGPGNTNPTAGYYPSPTTPGTPSTHVPVLHAAGDGLRPLLNA